VLRPAAAVLAAATALVLCGCSEGSKAFDSNAPDADPLIPNQQVVRSPAAIEPDLPYSTPPLVQRLPGPNGGVPGQVPETSGPQNPGGGTSQSNQK
jgi:hypothetical protein